MRKDRQRTNLQEKQCYYQEITLNWTEIAGNLPHPFKTIKLAAICSSKQFRQNLLKLELGNLEQFAAKCISSH